MYTSVLTHMRIFPIRIWDGTYEYTHMGCPVYIWDAHMPYGSTVHYMHKEKYMRLLNMLKQLNCTPTAVNWAQICCNYTLHNNSYAWSCVKSILIRKNHVTSFNCMAS